MDPTSGEYHSVALLGFAKNENLFLENGRWLADYVPGIVVRGPFLIGFQEHDVGGELRQEPMIHVDMDHPRVSHTEGEPVFLPKGGNSPYLDHIAQVLRGIHAGLEMSKAMFAAFAALDLIGPVSTRKCCESSRRYVIFSCCTIARSKGTTARSGVIAGASAIPASLARRIEMFQKGAHAWQYEGELFRVDSWTQVMLGQGHTRALSSLR